MSYRIVIPARLASQRLPDKPLLRIGPVSLRPSTVSTVP